LVTRRCRVGAPAALPLQFVLAAEIPILGLDPRAQRYAASLMDRYATLPMDYADASLVAVAEALRLRRVFTTDRRGFTAYRGARGKRFTLLPGA
jgi:predicted nucleic acid-binding protein